MIRRSFRIGLWLGLLAGAGFALAKIFRPKPGPSPVLDLGSPGGSLATSPSAWPPLEAPVPTPTPVQVPEPDVEPVVAAEEPGLVVVGDEPLQAPVDEPESIPEPPAPAPAPDPVPEPQPAPVPDPAPAAVAPAKKIAVKKKAAAPVKAPVAKKPAVKKAAPVKAAAPAKKAAAPKKTIAPWVDPKGTICPKTHPVKGKLSSNIYQVPGNFAYERTTPDRCYKTADAAEDDGMRAAKR